MAPDGSQADLDVFLAAHDPVDFPAAFSPGDLFGDWHVTAFLGHGGSGEVYRVVHAALGAAALKVCVRRPDRDAAHDAAACARFRREVALLAENAHPAFPRLLGHGTRGGRPWYVMELLEPRPLPASEREVFRFLLFVAEGVRHLHARGIVHRDIKPANILWRGSRPVLIDLGLAKDASVPLGHAGDSLSVVDGRAVGVGTPRSSAPEQLAGGDVTPAADVYALGMLVNDCFGGRPPRAWRSVVQRATSPLPQQRYRDAGCLVGAIRRRRVLRATAFALAGVVVLGASALAAWRLCRTPVPQEESQPPETPIEARTSVPQKEGQPSETRSEARTPEPSDEKRAQKEHDEILEMLQRDVY